MLGTRNSGRTSCIERDQGLRGGGEGFKAMRANRRIEEETKARNMKLRRRLE